MFHLKSCLDYLMLTAYLEFFFRFLKILLLAVIFSILSLQKCYLVREIFFEYVDHLEEEMLQNKEIKFNRPILEHQQNVKLCARRAHERGVKGLHRTGARKILNLRAMCSVKFINKVMSA